MRQMWMVALLLGLSACSGGAEKELRSQVDTLTRENVTLKAERDALKAQMAVMAGGMAQAAAAGRRSAQQEAINDYVRSCTLAVVSAQLDTPVGVLPPALDGVGCSDAALGDMAPKPSEFVVSSRISADPGSTDGFRIEAEGIGGERVTYPR